MVGIYLSGTGNTKYCIEKLVSLIHSSAKAIPMENQWLKASTKLLNLMMD